MIDFVLGGVLIIAVVAALVVWLQTATRGNHAVIGLGAVIAIGLLVLVAREAYGITVVDAMRVLLMVALVVAPIIALSVVHRRRDEAES
ncbi:MAG: hypothetical protein QF578_21185 [Alphaproteobacteria bacterium]|jgi:hypothetical protein|nr:hypothetical protein [Alphaproteobacteria bacterium]MDP6567357.1 hypothetical protein [Alphaproteobacteria bacterium]MDP6813063.1 hypothetical protein [Alphaproteobacteria bacterium]|tara:strand:- start:158 stop:424 length:267 start_codon:yes stop_codon:yes gene_type:complete